jgi:2-polyprenyl-3-methyl-5-hydroxy-6-metoxy-1,4-benzoquinol methylase
MLISLEQLQNTLKDRPLRLTDSLEKEYNQLVSKANQKEKKVKTSSFDPEKLNKEGADATLVNNPYLSAVHFFNYLAAKGVIESLVPKKESLPQINLLGIGEGSGIWSFFLASTLKPKSYLATDYQQWLVDYGQLVFGNKTLKFSRVDATKMSSIKSHSFDVVLACEFIEHISTQQLLAFLKQGKRVLKKNGVLIATTPNRACHPGKKFSGYPFHLTEFTAQELEGLIVKNLPQTFAQRVVFHLINQKICQEKRKGFFLEQLANHIYQVILNLFPKGSQQEKSLDKIMGYLYRLKKGERRRKLSFPKEYNQTRLVYQPRDETQAFGLCLVLQA